MVNSVEQLESSPYLLPTAKPAAGRCAGFARYSKPHPLPARSPQGQSCYANKPCASGLSCHPGHQICLPVPRREGQPCIDDGTDDTKVGGQRCCEEPMWHSPRLGVCLALSGR